MDNYTIFSMFENPRRGRQARNFTTNAGSENSRSQIVFRTDIFRTLTLGAPDRQASTALSQLISIASQSPVSCDIGK